MCSKRAKDLWTSYKTFKICNGACSATCSYMMRLNYELQVQDEGDCFHLTEMSNMSIWGEVSK